jgi:hypothetical protein
MDLRGLLQGYLYLCLEMLSKQCWSSTVRWQENGRDGVDGNGRVLLYCTFPAFSWTNWEGHRNVRRTEQLLDRESNPELSNNFNRLSHKLIEMHTSANWYIHSLACSSFMILSRRDWGIFWKASSDGARMVQGCWELRKRSTNPDCSIALASSEKRPS